MEKFEKDVSITIIRGGHDEGLTLLKEERIR